MDYFVRLDLAVLPRTRWRIDPIDVQGRLSMSAGEEAPIDSWQVAELVELSGDVDLASAEQALNILAGAIAQNPSGSVVVDLARVRFMDCRGLAALVWARNMIGDRLILGRPSAAITRLLDLTDLREFFVIVDERR
jgi:anti-anti-sigma factor